MNNFFTKINVPPLYRLDKYGKFKSATVDSANYFSYGYFQTEGPVNSTCLRGNEEEWGHCLMASEA